MDTAKTKIVARINKVDILLIENGEKRVAVKPICQALGIDEDAQRRRLKNDPILSSVTVLSTATGNDGKEYKMVTIPFEFVFGWLFRIDSRNVKEESREALIKYQVECYRTLYRHFTAYADFVAAKQEKIEEQLSVVDSASDNFKNAKNIMDKAKAQLKMYRQLTFDDYDAENRQMKIQFQEIEEIEE